MIHITSRKGSAKKGFLLWVATLLFSVTLLTVATTVFYNKKAEATLPGWPGLVPFVVPTAEFNKLYHCNEFVYPWNTNRWSPWVSQWISKSGSPTVTSVNVAYGASAVALDYWIAAATCIYSPNSVIDTNTLVSNSRVLSAPPGSYTFAYINGSQLYFRLGSGSLVGSFQRVGKAFELRRTGGFRASGDYVIQLDTRTINHFPGAPNFRCVATTPTPPSTTSLTNFAPCPFTQPTIRIHINVIGGPAAVAVYEDCTTDEAVIQANASTAGDIILDYKMWTGATEPSAWTPAVPHSKYYTGGPPNLEWRIPLPNPTLRWHVRAKVTKAGLTSESYRDVGPCASPTGSYTADPHPSPPNLTPNEEDPSDAVFDGNYDINSPVDVTGTIKLTRHYYIQKFSGATTDLSNATTTLSASEKRTGNHTLPTGTEALPALDAGDAVCQVITIDPGSADVDLSTGALSSPGAAIDSTPPACTYVVNKPYFSVYGGDVKAGGSIDNGGGCSALAASPPPILAFLIGNQRGAGTQLAGFAKGIIAGFATSKLNTPADAYGLAFANNVAGTGGLYGDDSCVTGYELDDSLNSGGLTGAGPFDITTGAWSPGGTTKYYFDHDITINGGSGGGIADKTKIALYVGGDLTINGNIYYENPSSWTSIKHIPSLTVIVAGNIYIDKSVTRLDGVFVSYADTVGNGGSIYTCTNGSSTYALTDNLIAPSVCGNQLVVHGSLIAKKIKWLRTYGSLRDAKGAPGEQPYTPSSPASVHAGELILSDPEIYLSSPALPKLNNSGAGGQFESIVSLPPVL